MRTRTGSFAIGFRRGWSDWQQDLPALCTWARENGFPHLDLNVAAPADLQTLSACGLSLGSVDLISMGDITHSDPGRRQEIIEQNLHYVKELSAAGARIFFTVVGGTAGLSRLENFKLAVESFAPLADAAAHAGSVIAVEGYPGGPPHYTMLCTTPETCREFLKEIPHGIALNYDPSHLIRLGVDHLRFLNEFAPQVAHVHGKDTQLYPDQQYEFGLYQPAAFAKPFDFGGQAWRYTLPGHGLANWTGIFQILHKHHYSGRVSIELEDQFFNGSAAGEQAGLITAMQFLASA